MDAERRHGKGASQLEETPLVYATSVNIVGFDVVRQSRDNLKNLANRMPSHSAPDILQLRCVVKTQESRSLACCMIGERIPFWDASCRIKAPDVSGTRAMEEMLGPACQVAYQLSSARVKAKDGTCVGR